MTTTKDKGNVTYLPSDLTSVPPRYSDDELAMRFSDQHAAVLRYVAERGRWYEWQSPVWREDRILDVFDKVRTTCREASNELSNNAADRAVAKIITGGKTIAAVEKIARSDKRHAAVPEQFDAFPWLINTPDGLFDLEKMRLIGPWQDGYATKVTACCIDFDCPTPIWNKFLKRVTGDDDELIAYLQRVCGYCLTGSTKEHAMFFLHGSGANGKSVFINTITGILSDYACTAPVEAFLENHSERHPTEVAMLEGARLVSSVETPEGRPLAESRIKALTGGDKVATRRMRQDFFQFEPLFKLIIAGNHKPSLRTIDEAIRRRFHLVPFTTTIPPEERDPDLASKLKAEWPGILAWMVAGCTDWIISKGLKPPKSVVDATRDYFEAEDNFALWMADRGVREPLSFEPDAKLFASWADWANRAGEHPGKRKQFVEKLEGAGLVKDRVNAARGHRGFRLYFRDQNDD